MKKWLQLFVEELNGGHSLPVAKTRVSCTCQQSKHEKVATTFCQSVARNLLLARCEALAELHPLAIKIDKNGHNFLPRCQTELFLGMFRSPGQATSIGNQNIKRCPLLFAKVSNLALFWPVVKPRPSFTHWQQNTQKCPQLFAKVLHGALSWPIVKPMPSCIHWHQNSQKRP